MATLGEVYKGSDVSGTAPQNSGRPEVLGIKNETPQVVKLLPLLNKTNKDGKALHYFKFDLFPYPVVRNGKLESWTRPSLEIQGKEDPQKKYSQELTKTIGEWKKGGYDKLPEYAYQFKQMEDTLKAIKPQSKVALLVVRPNEAKIHVLVTSPTVIDQLFGKSAYGDRAAVEALVDSMRKNGQGDAFDLTSNVGWVELSRTGASFMDTRYHAKPSMTVRQMTDPSNGQTFQVPVRLEAPVHLSILTTDLQDLPDVATFVNVFPWTEEEVGEFAASGFKVLPRSKQEAIDKYSKQQATGPSVPGGVPPSVPTPNAYTPRTPAFTAPVQQAPVQQAPPSIPSYQAPIAVPPSVPSYQAPVSLPTYSAPPAPIPTTNDLASFLNQTLPPKV